MCDASAEQHASEVALLVFLGLKHAVDSFEYAIKKEDSDVRSREEKERRAPSRLINKRRIQHAADYFRSFSPAPRAR